MYQTKSRMAARERNRRLIEKHLRLLKKGDPLPPVRSLMEMCNVSRAGIDSILKQLENDGLIDRRPRQGIFKSVGNEDCSEVAFVELVACGLKGDILQKGTFTSELVEALATEIGDRHQGLRLRKIGSDEPVSRYEALAMRSDVRACVLWGLAMPQLTNVFDWHHVAWVSLYPQTDFCQPGCIVDSPKMVEMQLKFLWDLGHRRIAYLDPVHPDAPIWTHLCRRESYYRLMAQRGFVVEPNWVIFGGHTDETIILALKEIFSRKPRPTAIIVGDDQLSGTYSFLQSCGLKVGKDVSVISTDDLSYAASMHPPATSVRNSCSKVAKLTLETLDKVLRGEKLTSPIEVPLELIVRESTGPAPKE